MEIPQAVIKQAQSLIEQYGDKIAYIGESEEHEIYQFRLPDDQENGFPIVYLYDAAANSVEEVGGMRALEILIPYYGEAHNM
jgi:hypothetical protein